MPFRVFCTIALSILPLSVSTLAKDRPNVIYILADDLGYGDLSHAGGKAATPHCDRLAREGMRFTDSHTTSSVCTPTRYGILTGRYNWRSTLKKGVLWGMSEPLIEPARLTVPGLLRKNGYQTAVIGKWHLGLGWHKLPNDEKRQSRKGATRGDGWHIDYAKKVNGGPLAVGFDESFIIPASLDMFPYLYLKNDKPTAWANTTKAFHRPGPAAEDFEAINCLRDFAREARSFIDTRAKDPDKPFFLYLPLTSPHTPIVPSRKWQGKSSLGKYGDFLMETDWVVGEVLAALDQHKLTKDTIVIFTADNGCSPAAKIPDLVKQGHKPNADWRGHKADIFEGGHRTPFLVRWPGRVKAGSTSAETLCTTDLFATLADILGQCAKIPANAGEDSFSFLTALTGKGAGKPTRPFTIHHSINGSFAIRRGPWKLALCPGSGGWSAPKPAAALKNKELPLVQLYNLGDDPAEQNNLSDQKPELVKELVGELAAAIRNGRTNTGPKQANEGLPNTFNKRLLTAFPLLGK
ncbi:MAG: arylsulfatase [Verrucomicrobiales bacterium]